MGVEYSVLLANLSSKQDLWGSRATPAIEQQLREQGRRLSNSYRYEATVEVLEGQRRPVTDIDNYAKRALDAITRSRLLWRDDEQIDKLVIREEDATGANRSRSSPSRSGERTANTPVSQHSFVPAALRRERAVAALPTQIAAISWRCMSGVSSPITWMTRSGR